jgi:iron complex outermembrane receptor protein
VEDSTSTTGLRTYLGNIPGVRARGIELEANYAATRNLKLNFNSSFNRATYLDFSTTAPDTSTPQIVNFAGRQLHGAPKVIVNVGVDYSHPIGKYNGRVFLNESYRSGAYLAANLSENTYQAAYSLVDGGVSLATADGKYEFSIVGKNLANKRYATGAATYSGSGAITTQPGYDRSLAAVFRAKL